MVATQNDLMVQLSWEQAQILKAAPKLESKVRELSSAVTYLGVQLAAEKAKNTTDGTPPVPLVVPSPRNLVAVIGAQWVELSGALIQSTLTSAPASFATCWQYGKSNKVINLPGSYGVYTTTNIAQARSSGTEPDLWILDLGEMHDPATTTDAMVQAGDLSNEMRQVDEVLAALGPAAHVMWVAQANQWSYPSAYGWLEKLNGAIGQRMTARGANGYFVDYWTWARDNRGASPMPTDAQKAAYIASQADAYMKTLSTTVTPPSGTTTQNISTVNFASMITD